MRSDLCTNSCSLRARRADLSVELTLTTGQEEKRTFSLLLLKPRCDQSCFIIRMVCFVTVFDASHSVECV